ncbi:hypothetical protein [Henriciella marina]|uniref:Uncharacterized protein n=1 Tax=Henriciella marina TaxID=453851 RepID=A0ABT4LQK4_9PROT|nr:hypothetical protein [Henriciella marina]MCZ4296543.1 hypothetical protein [Henriciella marina]
MKRTGLLLSALLLSACGRPFDNVDRAARSNTGDSTAVSIADAIAFYEEHTDVLGRSIEALERGAPQGSVEADLRRQFAVVAVSFYPAEAGVSDFGYITLSSGAPTNPEKSVALMYFADYDRSMLPYWTGQVFNTCGPEAADAVAHPKPNISEVYCRINDKWLVVETFTPSS